MYNYVIYGKTRGSADIQTYAGCDIEADSPRRAILFALAREFGVPSIGFNGTAADQLCYDGWIDRRDFDEQFLELKEQATSFILENGDTVYEVHLQLPNDKVFPTPTVQNPNVGQVAFDMYETQICSNPSMRRKWEDIPREEQGVWITIARETCIKFLEKKTGPLPTWFSEKLTT